jgi:hypothetical protein
VSDLVKPKSANLALSNGGVQGLVDLWLASQTAATAKTYKVALGDFARAVGRDIETAVELLLAGRGSANAMALAYKVSMTDRKLQNATVNLRLSALRSLVAHARSLDLVDWVLEVKGMPDRTYRDTRGPGRKGFQNMVKVAAKGPSAARDTAILWMLYGLALRRGEVAPAGPRRRRPGRRDRPGEGQGGRWPAASAHHASSAPRRAVQLA